MELEKKQETCCFQKFHFSINTLRNIFYFVWNTFLIIEQALRLYKNYVYNWAERKLLFTL